MGADGDPLAPSGGSRRRPIVRPRSGMVELACRNSSRQGQQRNDRDRAGRGARGRGDRGGDVASSNRPHEVMRSEGRVRVREHICRKQRAMRVPRAARPRDERDGGRVPGRNAQRMQRRDRLVLLLGRRAEGQPAVGVCDGVGRGVGGVRARGPENGSRAQGGQRSWGSIHHENYHTAKRAASKVLFYVLRNPQGWRRVGQVGAVLGSGMRDGVVEVRGARLEVRGQLAGVRMRVTCMHALVCSYACTRIMRGPRLLPGY